MPITDQNSVKTPPPMDEDDVLRDDLITALRIEETAYYGGNAFSTIIGDSIDSNDTEAEVYSSFAATIFAVFAGCAWFFARKSKFLSRHKAKVTTQNVQNPWSRRAKTSFVGGQKIGELVGSILFIWLQLPLLNIAGRVLIKITGLLFGIFFGVAGMIGFGVGKSLDTEKIYRFGRDGWTKYAKTGFVFGGFLGTALAGILCATLFTVGAIPTAVIIGSAVGSLLGFGLISLSVFLYHRYIAPAYHRYKVRKALADGKEPPPPHEPNKTYRTNFMRAGMVLGGFLGTIIGGLIGGLLLPVIGIPIGALLGNAIGSVIGGIAFAAFGPWLTKKIEGNGRPVNSVDYAIRTGAMLGNNTGLGQAAIPLANNFEPLKPSTTSGDYSKAMMPAIGGLIFSGIAFAREVYHAKKLKGEDDRVANPNFLLPWTQRAATGVMIGSVIGGFIGFFFPPFGWLIGAGVGGFLGGVIVCAMEPLGYKWGLIPLRKPKTNPAAETPKPSDATSPQPPSNQAKPPVNDDKAPTPTTYPPRACNDPMASKVKIHHSPTLFGGITKHDAVLHTLPTLDLQATSQQAHRPY